MNRPINRMILVLAALSTYLPMSMSARADVKAAEKWLAGELQPSTLSRQQQLDELKWFIAAAEGRLGAVGGGEGRGEGRAGRAGRAGRGDPPRGAAARGGRGLPREARQRRDAHRTHRRDRRPRRRARRRRECVRG